LTFIVAKLESNNQLQKNCDKPAIYSLCLAKTLSNNIFVSRCFIGDCWSIGKLWLPCQLHNVTACLLMSSALLTNLLAFFSMYVKTVKSQQVNRMNETASSFEANR